jgi:phenylpropionate dioxygenase-like ring-hydroxylating dioxygenase large terminal subunit
MSAHDARRVLPLADDTLPDTTAHFHPILRSDELGRGPRRVVIAGRPIVLFRDAARRAGALADQCPHRRTPLSIGSVTADGRLQCAYHGWMFDRGGKGYIPSDPTLPCRADAYQAHEHLGYIWVARASTPIERMPDFVHQAEARTGAWAGCDFLGPIDLAIAAPLPQVMDNFGEIEHVPYVHRVLGWDPSEAARMTVETYNGEDRTDAFAWGPQRDPPLGPLRLLDRLLLRRGPTSLLEYGFQFSPPHTTFMPGWGDPHTRERRAFSVRATSVLVPISAKETRLINFPFVKIHDPRLRLFLPLVKVAAYRALRSELVLDGRICEQVADVPGELKGMRLTAADGQVIHNRMLLDRIYYGAER